MSRIRLLFAWLVLAAIPLQGFAAASMLFCGTGERQQSQVQTHAPDQHDHVAHGHGPAAKERQGADSTAQLPDSSHQCGVCASCCHSAAMTETPRALALAPPPQAEAAEPFVLIHPRPSTVPDKPPRA